MRSEKPTTLTRVLDLKKRGELIEKAYIFKDFFEETYIFKLGLFGKNDLEKLPEDELIVLSFLESHIKFQRNTTGFPVSGLVKKGLIDSDFIKKIIVGNSSLFGNILEIKGEKIINNSAPNLAFLSHLIYAHPVLNETIELLLKYNILNKDNLILAFKKNTLLCKILTMISHKEKIYDHLKYLLENKILKPENFNRITLGINAPEIEALVNDLDGEVGSHSKRYGLDTSVHPLLFLMRNTQNKTKLSEQVEVVLGKSYDGDLKGSLDKVFGHYLSGSDWYTEISKEEENSKEQVEKNAVRANRLQLRKLLGLANREKVEGRSQSARSISNVLREYYKNFKKAKENGKSPEKTRYLNVYPRYMHGLMDPFQMYIIVRAIDWYIKSGHSKVFSKIRLVHEKYSKENFGEKNIVTPWTALLASPNLEIVDLSGPAFRSINIGGNTFYFTHSDSTDSSFLESIPIITESVRTNGDKYSYNVGNVNFNAFFDAKDPGAIRDDIFLGKTGFEGDIPGLINETLRCMRELENKVLKQNEEGH